jgi:hypothetical protein
MAPARPVLDWRSGVDWYQAERSRLGPEFASSPRLRFSHPAGRDTRGEGGWSAARWCPSRSVFLSYRNPHTRDVALNDTSS